MVDEELGLFGEKKYPDPKTAWSFYERGQQFNNQINLYETVKSNENFYVGKQWEGVQANGLPTPQFNILKRVVGFITATITTDNIKVNATLLNKVTQSENYTDPVRIINDEFEFLTEMNDIPSLMREFARNAAVDGDGCMYTYWDATVDAGNGAEGAIKTEIVPNTRVHFGNPNDKSVQAQPYIQIATRQMVRAAKRKAKANGISEWREITADSDESSAVDSAKRTDDKVTVLLTMWRDEDTDEIWAYESTQTVTIKRPYNMKIKLYPVCWLNWDYIQDCYHGQAMITGLIPNQLFINKIWAMTMLSNMRSAFPKIIYNKTLVNNWDNRVGAAIGIKGGDVNNVAKVIEPATISPQIAQFIELAITKTEESLGATSVALGDTRPDNTSAIIALQRAASTPSELTKQNLYKSIEELFRIYLEFIGEYYGTRVVNIEPPQKIQDAMRFANQPVPETIPAKFNFSFIKKNPWLLKLDVGASSYYSEIASMQTLENALQNGHLTFLQFLERIPDDYMPKRRALIAELKAAQATQMQAMPPTTGSGMPGVDILPEEAPQNEDIPTGGGYSNLQRAINQQGTTAGMV